MKKLLLTSAAFSNQKIKVAFRSLVNKPMASLKIVMITAARSPEENQYVREAMDELLELGVNQKNIAVLLLDHPVTLTDLKNTDMAYVCGGNTYYILQQMRRFGCTHALHQFVDAGRLYFGVSAGSIIAGPSIDIAGVGDTADSNEAELTDTAALDIVPFAVSPHYTDRDRTAIDQFENNIAYDVIRLTDEQAVMVKGENITII